MNARIAVAALALPALLAACGSTPAGHVAAPHRQPPVDAPRAAECAQFSAARDKISYDTGSGGGNVRYILAIVVNGKGGAWVRMLRQAAAVPGGGGRVRGGILLAEADTVDLRTDAAATDKAGDAAVSRDWDLLGAQLRKTAALCKAASTR